MLTKSKMPAAYHNVFPLPGSLARPFTVLAVLRHCTGRRAVRHGRWPVRGGRRGRPACGDPAKARNSSQHTCTNHHAPWLSCWVLRGELGNSRWSHFPFRYSIQASHCRDAELNILGPLRSPTRLGGWVSRSTARRPRRTSRAKQRPRLTPPGALLAACAGMRRYYERWRAAWRSSACTSRRAR